MYIVIFVTAKDKEEAGRIARCLLEQRLAACVNIVDGIQSVYWWQGKIEDSREALLVIKSKKDLFQKVVTAVKAAHSYDLPEVIALPIIEGSQDYLKWLGESCGGG